MSRESILFRMPAVKVGFLIHNRKAALIELALFNVEGVTISTVQKLCFKFLWHRGLVSFRFKIPLSFPVSHCHK